MSSTSTTNIQTIMDSKHNKNVLNNHRDRNMTSFLFDIFLYGNISFAYMYSTFYASYPFIMLFTHILSVLQIHLMASSNLGRNSMIETKPIERAISLFVNVPDKSRLHLLIFMLILTPLRIYSAGEKTCIILYIIFMCLLPLVCQDNWMIMIAYVVGGCLHSPFSRSFLCWHDTCIFLAVGALSVITGSWYHNQTQAVNDVSKAKDLFLSNIGHEVRTPLHGIMGSIEAIKCEISTIKKLGNESSKVEEWLEVMYGCAISLSEILDNMVQFSKLDSTVDIDNESNTGRSVETFSIRPFLKDISNLAIAYPKSSSVSFICQIAANVPNVVETDRVGLRQVLTNLVINSLKFTNNGTVILNVSVSSHTKSQSICFEVSDTGCGMSEEFMGKLFLPFSQEDPTPSRNQRGAGLGLFISATLAHRMGAHITAKSQKGQGTQITMDLPQPSHIFEKENEFEEKPAAKPATEEDTCSNEISTPTRRRHTLPFDNDFRSEVYSMRELKRISAYPSETPLRVDFRPAPLVEQNIASSPVFVDKSSNDNTTPSSSTTTDTSSTSSSPFMCISPALALSPVSSTSPISSPTTPRSRSSSSSSSKRAPSRSDFKRMPSRESPRRQFSTDDLVDLRDMIVSREIFGLEIPPSPAINVLTAMGFTSKSSDSLDADEIILHRNYFDTTDDNDEDDDDEDDDDEEENKDNEKKDEVDGADGADVPPESLINDIRNSILLSESVRNSTERMREIALSPPAPLCSSKFGRKPLSALVVDDNLVNVKVLTHHLKSIGFAVDSVCSGEDAVDKVIENLYDVIFLDVYMPGIGGIETARRVSSSKNAPKMMIGCSADTRGSIIAECKGAGMTEFLGKPFKKQSLKEVYDTLTKMRHLEENC